MRFCLSGVILTAKAVLDAKPDASERRSSGGTGRRALPLLHTHAHGAGHSKVCRREPVNTPAVNS